MTSERVRTQVFPDTYRDSVDLMRIAAEVEGFDLERMGHNSAEYVHTVTEALKLALADRDEFYGDPDFARVPAAFLALSSFTSRALAVGLGYVLLWEGVLAGLFEGTRAFSIRQATLGLAALLQGGADRADTLGSTTSAVVLGAVILGSLGFAGWRLSRYQIKGGD